MVKHFTFAAFCLGLLITPLEAREFSVKGPEWNDLSQALDIVPFYLTLKDDAEVKSFSLVIEVYKEGKILQTLESTGVGLRKESAVDLKSAIYFLPPKEETIEGVIVLGSNGDHGRSRFHIPKSFLPPDGTRSMIHLLRPKTPLAIPGKTALFAILYSPSGSYSSGDADWQGLLEANPEATIFVAFLKAE